MRLTLRTLLAWLDDKLEPAEVREIGRQVAETPYAQDLIDRMYRVTRRRRLLVPPSTGPESVDPNLVAEYLDNALSPEDVADYEKRCLTSDLNLAEVASVHQILSLIGQRAKVPGEAKHRMYRLVKGRETVVDRPSRTAAPPAPKVHEPVTRPIASWASTGPPRKSLRERFGFAALVAGLLLAVVWTAFRILTPDESQSGPRRGARTAPIAVSTPPTPATVVEQAPVPKVDPDAAAQQQARLDAAKIAEAKAAEAKAGPFTLAKADAPALVFDAGKSEWTRIAVGSALKDDARVLGLAPFWTTLKAGPIEVILVGDTELTLSNAARGAGAGVAVDHGRAILKGASTTPYLVRSSGKDVKLSGPPGMAVGLERTFTRPPGVATAGPALLTIFVPEGETTVEVGDSKQTVKGPMTVEVDDKGVARPNERRRVPAWVNEAGPSAAEKTAGDRFAKFFSPSGPILRDLVQAVDGDDPDVRRLAIGALGAVGDAEMIVPVLNNAKTDAPTRRAAADVLRAMIARGGPPARAVSNELTNVFGTEWAGPTEKLFVGYTEEETRQEATYANLIPLLSAPELGTREQALLNLMSLTGRDSLEYDPIKPDPRALKAWQDLLHKKELMKAPPPAPVPAR